MAIFVQPNFNREFPPLLRDANVPLLSLKDIEDVLGERLPLHAFSPSGGTTNASLFTPGVAVLGMAGSMDPVSKWVEFVRDETSRGC